MNPAKSIEKLTNKIFKFFTKTRRRKILSSILVVLILLTSIRFALVKPSEVKADSLIKFDEGYGSTVNDANSNVTGTITNATWQTNDLCFDEKCLFFDGTGDFISFGDDADLDFAETDDFTIEFWFRHPVISTSADYAIAKHESGTAGGYKIWMDSDGDMVFGVDDDGTWDTTDTIGGSLSNNYDDSRWHHVAAVKNDTTGIYIFVDGILIDSNESLTETGTLVNGANFYVGIDADGSSNGWEGFIDEVKIYASARTQAEINADVLGATADRGSAAAFGPDQSYLSDGLVGYWKMDDNVTGDSQTITDYSGNSNGGTTASAGDASLDCGTSGKFNYGCDLDGSDDYITVVVNDSLDAATEFTISAWVKQNDSASLKTHAIVDKRNSSLRNYSFVIREETTNWLRLGLTDENNNSYSWNQDTAFNPGEWESIWHHVAVSFDINKNIHVYADGKEIPGTWDTVPPKNLLLYTNTNEVFIGNGDEPFEGSLDEVRVYTRALSPVEIEDLYKWAPGPIGYWKLDEGSGLTAYDSSSNENSASFTNLTEDNRVAGKYAGGIHLDNTSGEYLNAGSPALLDDLHAGGFTVMAWLKRDGTEDTGPANFLNKKSTGTSGWDFGRANGSGFVSARAFFDGTNDASTVTSTTELPVNEWAHVAMTYDNSGDRKVRIYINSVEAAYASQIASDGAATSDSTANLQIGHGSDNFEGDVDEIRIYNYVRTEEQITQDMNAGHPAPGSPVGSAIGWWRMDKGYGNNGDTINDSSPQGNDATLYGGSLSEPAWVAPSGCVVNKCLDFDSANVNQLRVGDVDAYDAEDTSDFTLTGWFNRETFDADHTIIAKRNGQVGSDTGYILYIDDANDTLIFEIADQDTDEYQLESSTTFTSSGWNYFAVVWDQDSATNSEIYINGRADGTNPTGTIGDIGDSSNGVGFRIGAESDNGNPFNGKLDEIKIYSSAFDANQVALDYNFGSSVTFGGVMGTQNQEGFSVPHPYLEYTFNENGGQTATDTGNDGVPDDQADATLGSSGSVDTNDPEWVPVTGNHKDAFSLTGSALDFDGSNDYLDANDVDKIEFGDKDSFSIEAWINRDTFTSDNTILTEGSRDPDSFDDTGYTVWVDDTDDIRASFTDGADYCDYDGAGTITSTGWHHVVITWDETNNRVRIFLDGKNDNENETCSTAFGTVGAFTNAQDFRVGSNISGGKTFAGQIGLVRIYNSVLTSSQINYRYNRGKPTSWWMMDECSGTNLNDAGINGVDMTITPGAGTHTSAGTCGSTSASEMWDDGITGKINYSLDFDGDDDYATASDNDVFDINSTNNLEGFTVSAWVNRETFNTFDVILAKDDDISSISSDDGWQFFINPGDKIYFGIGDVSNGIVAGSTTTITSSGWHHIVGVYSSSTATIYYDGNFESSGFGVVNVQNNALDIRIGAESDGDHPFAGEIDDVRFYQYGLSADQVKRLYNQSAQYFGPKTGAP